MPKKMSDVQKVQRNKKRFPRIVKTHSYESQATVWCSPNSCKQMLGSLSECNRFKIRYAVTHIGTASVESVITRSLNICLYGEFQLIVFTFSSEPLSCRALPYHFSGYC